MNKLMFKVGKRSLFYASILLCSLFLKACSSSGDEPTLPEEEDPVPPSQAVKVVTMEADNILSGNGGSRTAFTLESDKLKFGWAEGDKVGVWPKDGSSSQVSFSITSGYGQNVANFDGGAYALRDDVQYAAYYPYNVSNTESNNSNIRFSYEGQAQTGNGSLAHLGSHDLMATQAIYAENGKLNFKFKHLNCVAMMRLMVPDVASFTSLTVRSEEEIFAKVANLDLSGETYAWSILEATNQLQMNLTDVSSTAGLKEIVCFMMLPPVDMSGKTVHVILQSSDNKVYQGQLASKNMQPGYAYSFSATLVDVTVSSDIQAPVFGDQNT